MSLTIYRSRPGEADPLCTSTLDAKNQSQVLGAGFTKTKCVVCLTPVVLSPICDVATLPPHDHVIYAMTDMFHKMDPTIDPATIYTLTYGFTATGITGPVWGTYVRAFGVDNECVIAISTETCPHYFAGFPDGACAAGEIGSGLYAPNYIAFSGIGVCIGVTVEGNPPGTPFDVHTSFWWTP